MDRSFFRLWFSQVFIASLHDLIELFLSFVFTPSDALFELHAPYTSPRYDAISMNRDIPLVEEIHALGKDIRLCCVPAVP